jgi:hypothetical protein
MPESLYRPKNKCAVCDYRDVDENRSVCDHCTAPAVEDFSRDYRDGKRYLADLFKLAAPQCEPSDKLMNLVSQIDNYIAGQRDDLTEARRVVTLLHDATILLRNAIVAGDPTGLQLAYKASTTLLDGCSPF